MSNTGGTSCGPAYANRVGNCCTAVLNGGLMVLNERRNFLWPYFSTHRSFLSWARWIQTAPLYPMECISFSVVIPSLPGHPFRFSMYL